MQNKHQKVVIYGGNGFVGTHLAERLACEDVSIVCLSRSGHKPLHLHNQPWSENVRWCKGDANYPDNILLAKADVVVIMVGSAPVPTLSKEAFDEQLKSNGLAPCKVIKCAKEIGVKRIILMGAHVPFFLNSKNFAYARGKKMALDAAESFANISDSHSAVVVQPGAIYGKRHLSSGKVLPLDTLLYPFTKIAPSQFTCIKNLSNCLADIIVNGKDYAGKFTLIKPEHISASNNLEPSRNTIQS